MTTAVRTKLSLLTVVAAIAAALVAQPGPADAAGRVVSVHRVDGQLALVRVYSPALRATITNQVLLPGGADATPVFYLLNGKSGGVDGDSWLRKTRYRTFFAGKRVTVVSPVGGGYTWYSTPGWQRYLTHELPAAIDARFPTTGRAAIAGLSHSASAALDIAGRDRRFVAAASYSGCPSITSPLGTTAAVATMASGGQNAFAVFGAPGGPGWIDHDPARNPRRLAGKAVYLGVGSGVPGRFDGPILGYPGLVVGPTQVETVVRDCTSQMRASLIGAGVRHSYRVFATGAHTWGLFYRELKDSWRTLGPAL
ncbi:MAG: esterase family protein, partial [Gordonia sp. (in: high G+C Gram-positive bacteria)]|nr:esterase family protein [Gordonia sp. (in: high G+C Gram-positive bacteria)]